MVCFLLGQYGIFLSEEKLIWMRLPQRVSLKRYCEFVNTATVCEKRGVNYFCQIYLLIPEKCTSGKRMLCSCGMKLNQETSMK